MRVLYDASASQVQLCPVDAGNPAGCGAPVPRPFTLGAATGTLTFPGIFDGRMLSSGDVTIPELPLTFTLGATTATVRVTLTTGLVAMDGAVAQGTPLQGLGSFTLVGRIDGERTPGAARRRPDAGDAVVPAAARARQDAVPVAPGDGADRR